MRQRISMTPQVVPAEQNLKLSFMGRVWRAEEVQPEDPPGMCFSGEATKSDGSTFTIGFTMSNEVFLDLGSPEEIVLRVQAREDPEEI